MVSFIQEKFTQKTKLQIIGSQIFFCHYTNLSENLSLPTNIWQSVYFRTFMPDIFPCEVFRDAFPDHIFFLIIILLYRCILIFSVVSLY